MPHSVTQRRGVSGVVPEHDSQARSGVDSPADVSALNAPARGAGMEAAGP
jgi:hypothetical protein